MVLASKMDNKILELYHREIVKRSTRPILTRPRYSDWVIGLIGERGDCKTIGGTKITCRDFMLKGRECYSNLQIKVTIVIDDDHPACQYFGIPGGEMEYESLPLDKKALFRLDERYRGAIVFADEINLDLAEARRSTSNVNLNLDKVGQEIRHLQMSLIYTVIDEMWVDSRIRQLTDVFVRSADTALDPDGLQNNATPGLLARWQLYALTRRFSGTSYRESQQYYGPHFIHVRNMWDAYDTLETQASQSLKYGQFIHQKDDIEVTPTAEHAMIEKDWSWLEVIARDIQSRDDEVIYAEEYYNHPLVLDNKISPQTLTKELKNQHNIDTDFKYVRSKRKPIYII